MEPPGHCAGRFVLRRKGAPLLELLQIFFDNIAPILVISAGGFLLGRWKGVDPRTLGRVIFYIFSPSLVFDSLSKTDVDAAELTQIALVMLLFVGIMTLLAYGVARWRGDDRLSRAGLMLSAICPNNGNFGLPLIGFAFNNDVLARAVVVYVVVTFLNYSMGIFVASTGKKPARQAVKSILQVPMIYAAMAGLLVNSLDIPLAPVVQRSFSLAAQGSIPAMLVLLGLQLAQVTSVTHVRLASVGAGLRLLVSPLVALALIALLGVQGPASIAVIMQASMPVAIVTIIFATEFGLDDKFMSSAILTSTLLSPLTLTILILLLRRATPFGLP